jgi:hypothetical protein
MVKKTFLSAGMIAAAMFFSIAFLAPTPAFAIDGRTAVGMCIDSTADGTRCAWNVNDKGQINICNKSGCVYCESATSECVVAAKTHPRPTKGLPAGTTVETPLGQFKVTPRAFTGSFLKVPTNAGKADTKP